MELPGYCTDAFNFVEEFNLAFKKPNNDTCKLCDKFETIFKCSTVNEEKQNIIEEKKYIYIILLYIVLTKMFSYAILM